MAVSYRKRGKKNLWDYRVFDKHKQVVASNSGFRTKREAEIEALEIELRLMRGVTIDKLTPLYELWKKWFELRVKPLNKSESTMLKHELRGKVIKRYFGNQPASSIKSSDYQAAINDYAKQVTKDTIRRLNAEVRKVIQFARQDKIKIDDFTKGVIITGKAPGKLANKNYLSSLSDYRTFLIAVKNKFNSKGVVPYLLYIQSKTGMRFGEVVGLTWDCIKWEEKVIYTYRRYDSTKHQWRPPKTDTSVREIPVDDETLHILCAVKNEQERYFKRINFSNDENFIFINPHYGVPSNTAVNKYLRALLRKIQIQPYDLTSTGLRHTYASVLLGQGIDIWVIAKNMGHKDIKQITETYGHLIKEKADRENDKVREFLAGEGVSIT